MPNNQKPLFSGFYFLCDVPGKFTHEVDSVLAAFARLAWLCFYYFRFSFKLANQVINNFVFHGRYVCYLLPSLRHYSILTYSCYFVKSSYARTA